MPDPEEKTTNDEGQEPEEGGEEKESGEEKKAALEPWRDEIEKIRAEQQSQNARMMGVLGEMTKAVKNAAQNQGGNAPVPKTDDMNDEDRQALYEMAQKNPTIWPKMIDQEIERGVGKKLNEFKKDLMSTLSDQDAAKELQRHLGVYAGQISDSNNEIMQATPQMKALVEKIISPEFRGTQAADALAFLAAAGSNPQAVAKVELARKKADTERMNAQADRLATAAGIGRPRSQSKEPDLTEKDYEIAEKYGIDLKDPKVRAEILAGKKSQSLAGIGYINFAGEEQ
jgi:hypothetical protein